MTFTMRPRNIICQFKNMPVLKELSVMATNISVLDLEVLHTNLPTIQNLELMLLHFLHSDLPESIIPAAKLTKFYYHATSCVNMNALPIWYNYMSKKYANVVDFFYDDQCLSRIDFDTARQIYENGLAQLLQISGLSMCHRVFKNVPDGIDVFESLDSGSSKIKRLDLRYCQGGTLFQFLAQSKHVKMLFLKETEVGTPNSLRSLTSLIKLDLNLVFIDDRQAEIDFTSYLNAFPPSLQYFSAKCPSILFNESTVSTNITVLHILCCEIDKECGDILSNCFPKLKY